MLSHYLKKLIENAALDDIHNLKISLNIDRLPLFESSKTSVRLILCSIDNIKCRLVFLVSFAVCVSKPSNLDFLTDCITELRELCHHGITVEGRDFAIDISLFAMHLLRHL